MNDGKNAAVTEAEALRARARALKAKRVRALLSEGMPLREIARVTGLHHDTIRKIRAGDPRWA